MFLSSGSRHAVQVNEEAPRASLLFGFDAWLKVRDSETGATIAGIMPQGIEKSQLADERLILISLRQVWILLRWDLVFVAPGLVFVAPALDFVASDPHSANIRRK